MERKSNEVRLTAQETKISSDKCEHVVTDVTIDYDAVQIERNL